MKVLKYGGGLLLLGGVVAGVRKVWGEQIGNFLRKQFPSRGWKS